MKDLINRASRSLQRRLSHAQNNIALENLNRQVFKRSGHAASLKPVVFFNASTRLEGLSLNAAYQLITSWAVRLSGTPVINFACQGGMSRCVLGTKRENPYELPPCPLCINQSRSIHSFDDTRWFIYQKDLELESSLQSLDLDQLQAFEWQKTPLGSLVLPSMRWILRRHHLEPDESTLFLYRQYILSAWQVLRQFSLLLDQVDPQAVVVFNGMFFPEATARWAAWQRGLRVVSHEVGLQPYTAFFTPGDATAYPIQIPGTFSLTEEQNIRLDQYLSQRMQGNFSMAGIRFWPEMRGLDEDFNRRSAKFEQIVPVFTNVIFDTSQPHSNVVFPHMFAWLDSVIDLAKVNHKTLFVIRAHPDEARPGKESRESVSDWAKDRQVDTLPNVLFVPPQEFFSSYELIQRAKFVMVYNSTIGLEAAIMGSPVLCAGKARFTQIPTVFFPGTPGEYWQKAQEFLSAAVIQVPIEFQQNARRFLYYQLYRSSLPFSEFIEDDGFWKGYVRLKKLEISRFDPVNSPVLKIIVDGVLHGKDFLME